MMQCPRCGKRLVPVRLASGRVLRCRYCGGHAVPGKAVPALAGETWARSLRERAASSGTPGVACPSCGFPSVEVKAPVPAGEVTVDLCGRCSTLWLDPAEFDRLPRARARRLEDADPSTQARRMDLARAIASEVAEARPGGAGFGAEIPDAGWKWVAAGLGLPVEVDAASGEGRPWATWGLSAALVAVFLVSLADLPWFVETLGLVPARALRHGGLTFLTGNLLHAGWFHLMGNLYFLMVFGDNVEHALGRLRFGALAAAAALGGDLLHVALDPAGNIPCVGASGWISGLLAFYALRFPRARVGMFVLRRFWIHVPAWFAMAGWVFLQVATALEQVAGAGSVSGLAHLGGAAAGVAAWFAWGRPEGAGRLIRVESPAAVRR